MSWIQSGASSIQRLFASPTGELTRWQSAARYGIDLAWHCAKALKHDKAGQMAAALTYRTIFSLIPIVVLSLVVFNAFDGFKDMKNEMQTKALQYLGLATIGTGQPFADIENSSDEENAKRNMVVDNINAVIENIESLDFKSIGAIGLVLLILTAIGLVIAMEHSFNQVFATSQGRSFARRVMLYWAALTLGPVLILVSIYMATQAVYFITNNPQIGPFLGPVLKSLSGFTAVGATWLLLMLLYITMPNTTVRLKAAAIGALVAAILWETAKFAFALYVKKLIPYSKLYGTLGLIPLFLYWVYLTWLIILFGLELTYTLQGMKGRQFKHDEKKQDDQVMDPAWLVPLAAKIAAAFESGKTCALDELGRAASLTPRATSKLISALQQAGLVHYVINGDQMEKITLARPANKIPVTAVIDAGHLLLPTTASNEDPAWNVVKQLNHNNHAALEGQTLADLCVKTD